MIFRGRVQNRNKTNKILDKIFRNQHRGGISMSPSNQCRLCSCNFKVKFVNLSQTSYILTENLFNPSQRKLQGTSFSTGCQKVGLEVVKCEKYSSRVCNPCARKVRNLGSLYSFVKKAIEGEISKSTPANKRLLDTPGRRSPIRKSVRVFSPVTKTNNEKSPRKTLKFEQESLQISEKENSDNLY